MIRIYGMSNMLVQVLEYISKLIFLWQYKRHLKKRIEKNNFGRREEW
jgi:hypothetical protein